MTKEISETVCASLICRFCNKVIPSKIGLEKHQTTNRACIKLQLKSSELAEVDHFKLENKLLKYELKEKDLKILDLTNENGELKKEIEEKDISDIQELKLREEIPEYKLESEKGDEIVDLVVKIAETQYTLGETQNELKKFIEQNNALNNFNKIPDLINSIEDFTSKYKIYELLAKFIYLNGELLKFDKELKNLK